MNNQEGRRLDMSHAIDLWQRLYDASQRHQVEWIWVKGHSGLAGNEKADELARLAIGDDG